MWRNMLKRPFMFLKILFEQPGSEACSIVSTFRQAAMAIECIRESREC
jgi:hypothetical protein